MQEMAHHDGHGAMNAQELASAVSFIMKAADADKSGSIDEEELKHAVSAWKNWSHSATRLSDLVKDLLKKYDTDMSGSLDKSQLIELLTALNEGAPIFVDATMVGAGIIRNKLKCSEVICTLNDPGVADDAKAEKTTRSAAAISRWTPRLAGAVVAIGNAPTALFRLLELIADGAPKPAIVLGFPVGFVGAAESKELLAADQHGLDFITLKGRIGGSAIAAAALNALAPTQIVGQP